MLGKVLEKKARASGPSAELEQLLAGERALPAAPSALRARSVERAQQLLLRASSPSAVPVALERAGGSWRSRLRTLPIAAFVLGFGGLAAAAAGVQHYWVTAAIAPPAAVTLVIPSEKSRISVVTPKPSEAEPRVEQEPRVAPDVPKRRIVSVKKVEPEAVDAPETQPTELYLLQAARVAIARGQHSSALGQLNRHRKRFPNGHLGQERDALSVRALWDSGARGRAQRAAARFKKRYPKSGLLSWMEP